MNGPFALPVLLALGLFAAWIGLRASRPGVRTYRPHEEPPPPAPPASRGRP